MVPEDPSLVSAECQIGFTRSTSFQICSSKIWASKDSLETHLFTQRWTSRDSLEKGSSSHWGSWSPHECFASVRPRGLKNVISTCLLRESYFDACYQYIRCEVSFSSLQHLPEGNHLADPLISIIVTSCCGAALTDLVDIKKQTSNGGAT